MATTGLIMNSMNKSVEYMVGWIDSAIETVTQTTIGQLILKWIDRFLWIVEKSAQWSLPYQEFIAEENGKSFGKMELVRPLPWVLFLPGLVILRAIRAGLNIGAFLLGYPAVQPSGMVKFIQKGRRKLRVIKVNGMKNMRRKNFGNKDKRLSLLEAKKALIKSIRLTLSTLSCLDGSKSNPSPPPTKIRITGTDLEPAPSPEEKSTTESAGSPVHGDTKRKFSEVSSDDQTSDESDNEPLDSQIDKYALEEDSVDDPDFNPADCSTTESSVVSSENSEVEREVNTSEIRDILEEAKAEDEFPESMITLLKQVGATKQENNNDTNAVEEDSRRAIITSSPKINAPGYYSPTNSAQDGDATFYSPISSKSASPERSFSPVVEKLPAHANRIKAKDFGNGELVLNAGSIPPGTSSEDTTNGVVLPTEKPNTNTGKSHHHRGRRTSHGNRKKK